MLVFTVIAIVNLCVGFAIASWLGQGPQPWYALFAPAKRAKLIEIEVLDQAVDHGAAGQPASPLEEISTEKLAQSTPQAKTSGPDIEAESELTVDLGPPEEDQEDTSAQQATDFPETILGPSGEESTSFDELFQESSTPPVAAKQESAEFPSLEDLTTNDPAADDPATLSPEPETPVDKAPVKSPAEIRGLGDLETPDEEVLSGGDIEALLASAGEKAAT